MYALAHGALRLSSAAKKTAWQTDLHHSNGTTNCQTVNRTTTSSLRKQIIAYHEDGEHIGKMQLLRNGSIIH